MEKRHIEDISDFLGKEDTRYFSNGFRFMDCNYGEFMLEEKVGSCELYLHNRSLDGLFSGECHIGAIEYVSIASTLCETTIMSLYSLTEKEIASSWVYSCRMKVSSCTYVDENKSIIVRCRVLEVNKDTDSINGYKSQCEVMIGNVSIKMGVDHPINAQSVERGRRCLIEHDLMYVTGYKKRKHIIRDLDCSTDERVCIASLRIEDYYECRKGLGAGYRAFIIPDVINISGQLAQVLLYKLEDMTRQEANNMWLREFSITYNRPYEKRQCEGKVAFSRFDTIVMKGETWRSVSFSSQIGDVFAQFKIAHKLNNNI